MAVTNNRLTPGSDSALMRAYALGDLEAFVLLYQRNKRPVYDFLFLACDGNAERADELFRDVWTSVIRMRQRFETESSFGDWLNQLAWQRFRGYSVGSDDDSGVDEQAVVLYRKQSGSFAAVDSQWEDLPQHQRDVLLLRYCLNFNFPQISGCLSLTLRRVRNCHDAAVVALRNMLRKAS